MRAVEVIADTAENAAYVSQPVVLDQYIAPSNINMFTNGSGTIQGTLTDPYPKVNGDFVEQTNFVWTNITTTNGYANLGNRPFRAVRLSGAALNDTLTVVQAGAL